MKYRIEVGPSWGESIERIDDSSEGLVICPSCGADVREETIRFGRCEECPEENSPMCERCNELNESPVPDSERTEVWHSFCAKCQHWTEHL